MKWLPIPLPPWFVPYLPEWWRVMRIRRMQRNLDEVFERMERGK